MKFVIFYSWQSDLPNAENRGLIQEALEEAVKSLHKDDEIIVEPVIERDTSGIPGSPDIAGTIFDKINVAHAFVADISIITSSGSTDRPTPNPNVLVETGWALARQNLGQARVIFIVNSAYGSVEQLPFDLRMRRVIQYKCGPEDRRGEARRDLAGKLVMALRAVIDHHVTDTTIESIAPSLYEQTLQAIENKEGRSIYLIDEYTTNFVYRLGRLNPKHRTTPDEKTGINDLFIAALNDSVPLVEQFSRICRAISHWGDLATIQSLYSSFGKIYKSYFNDISVIPPGGMPPSIFDQDLAKFICHETFVTFIACLMNENRWEIIGNIFTEQIYIDKNRRGEAEMINIDSFPVFIRTLDNWNNQQIPQWNHPQGQILERRHKNGPLTTVMPFNLFISADYFLWLRTEISDMQYDSRGWIPRSVTYLDSLTPKFLFQAERQTEAIRIAKALDVPSVDELRTRLKERSRNVTKLFRDAFDFGVFTGFDFEKIGSKP
ncbi:MAG: hypothetical protein ABIY70_00145 [Capsulimonas sp.]|uniref:hypothetical protein n=1 Tax=Capsulimonas sp. TaxID=2494211 RepID=UPI0032662E26